MSAAEQRRVAGLLQVAADQLSAGIPSRVGVGLRNGRLTFDAVVWTSAMTRERLTFAWRLGNLPAASSAASGAISWDAAAASIVNEMIGRTVQVQVHRWELATSCGLVSDGDPVSLRPSELLIDRTLLAMLEARSIDVRRLAALVSPDRDFQVGDELPSVTIAAPSERIFVRQVGASLPVVSKWLTIGNGTHVCYDGTYVALDGPLLEAVITSAPGRRLGDLIATGAPELDRRIIAKIHEFGEHPHGVTVWEEALAFYIELVPDHVRLGAAHGADVPEMDRQSDQTAGPALG